jgi:hypothetical protein
MPLPIPTRTSGNYAPMPVIGGHSVPSFLLRPATLPANMPADDLGKKIVTMLASHPDIATRHRGIDVSTLDDSSKRAMLDRINADLGIRPIRKRTLDFVRD